MTSSANPLLSDRDVDFQLYEVLDAAGLCALPAFSEHSRETFELEPCRTRPRSGSDTPREPRRAKTSRPSGR
jgi:hypothetical protein